MRLQELFRAARLPVLQNRVYKNTTEAKASPTGDVILVQDLDSGLVFNEAFDQSLLVYDQNYQNEQALSAAFKEHLDAVITILDRHLRDKTVIEVGCGKGYFLELLLAAGYQATGIDPAYQGDSPHVMRAPFEPGLGLSAGAIVLRHVLEHIPAPVDFLNAIAEANGGTGLIYIEVPCLDWICKTRAWFDVFYEHVNYFRLPDLERMFGRVVDSGRLFGEQYIYIIADLATLRHPIARAADAVKFPSDFAEGVETCSAVALSDLNRRVAIWGASSKGVIFSNYMSRAGVQLDMAIDINPEKQGRFMASSGLPIVSPEKGLQSLPSGSLMFVMNSNYRSEIVSQSQGRYEYISIDSYL